jgi:hypothetical protein
MLCEMAKSHPLRVPMWLVSLGAAGCLYALFQSGSLLEIGNLPIVMLLLAMIPGGILLGGITVSVPRLNRAADAFGRADFAEVRAILEEADQASKASSIKRAVDLQRAEMAWAKGDLLSARAFVELAANRSSLGDVTNVHRGVALALRALIRAAKGETDQARLDIARARTHGSAIPSGLARAELAEAMVLAKAGDRPALERHLEKNRTLLRQLAPRERAAARALERFALAGDQPPMHADAPLARACGEVPSLSTWLANVLPIDLPLAAEPEIAVPPMQPIDADVPPAMLAGAGDGGPTPLRAAKGRGTRSVLRGLVVYAFLILMFLACWQFLQSDLPTGQAETQDRPTKEGR